MYDLSNDQFLYGKTIIFLTILSFKYLIIKKSEAKLNSHSQDFILFKIEKFFSTSQCYHGQNIY